MKTRYQLAFSLAETRLVYKPKEHLYDSLPEAMRAAKDHPTCDYILKVTSAVVWRADGGKTES